MKNLIITTIILCLGLIQVEAQCPKSSKEGIHVVQPKENLYRISKKYNVALQDICMWNGITMNQVLPVCKELIVKRKKDVKVSPIPVVDELGEKSGNTFKTDRQHRHVIKKGETIKKIADKYGYTEKRFREMNGLKPKEELLAGSTLVTSNCYCSANVSQPAPPAPTPTITITQPTNHTTTRVTTPQPTTITSDLLTPRSEDGQSFSPAPLAPYMSTEEYSMIKEINLLRSNPALYIPYVREFKREQNAKGWTVYNESIKDLIQELRSTAPLGALHPAECMYRAAKGHGDDLKVIGSANHIGTNGSWPWDRVKKSCPDFHDGNENLVGGPETVRNAVILLLIDHGIATKGHRENLLNPYWTHVVCHKVGDLGTMPNVWVQKFGQL